MRSLLSWWLLVVTIFLLHPSYIVCSSDDTQGLFKRVKEGSPPNNDSPRQSNQQPKKPRLTWQDRSYASPGANNDPPKLKKVLPPVPAKPNVQSPSQQPVEQNAGGSRKRPKQPVKQEAGGSQTLLKQPVEQSGGQNAQGPKRKLPDRRAQQPKAASGTGPAPKQISPSRKRPNFSNPPARPWSDGPPAESNMYSQMYPRRSEMLKLEKMVDGGLAVFDAENLDWAQCMDDCLAQTDATIIYDPVWLMQWQRVLRYRICSSKHCHKVNDRRDAAHSRKRFEEKVINSWGLCMDYCNWDCVQKAPADTIDLPARATLDTCTQRCEGHQYHKSRKYQFVPRGRVWQQVNGEDAWFKHEESRTGPPGQSKKGPGFMESVKSFIPSLGDIWNNMRPYFGGGGSGRRRPVRRIGR